MDYDPHYIIRFKGKLTKGPNAGKDYDYHNSWGGNSYPSEKLIRQRKEEIKQREPDIETKMYKRQYDETQNGFHEEEIE